MIEDAESPEQAAVRELWEETGYKASSLELLGQEPLMANRLNSRGYCFFAHDCQLDGPKAFREESAVILVTPKEFKELVVTGGFEHIAGLSLLSLAEWKIGIQLIG